MSFLDNLENNLKAMESLEATGLDDSRRRDAERSRALAIAPWAERLKKGPYVPLLMRDLTRAGFSRRVKVNFIWIDRTLRAEAMEQRLDLEPTPSGVEAVFADQRLPVDLDGQPDKVVAAWLKVLDAKLNERAALSAEIEDEDDLEAEA